MTFSFLYYIYQFSQNNSIGTVLPLLLVWRLFYIFGSMPVRVFSSIETPPRAAARFARALHSMSTLDFVLIQQL